MNSIIQEIHIFLHRLAFGHIGLKRMYSIINALFVLPYFGPSWVFSFYVEHVKAARLAVPVPAIGSAVSPKQNNRKNLKSAFGLRPTGGGVCKRGGRRKGRGGKRGKADRIESIGGQWMIYALKVT